VGDRKPYLPTVFGRHSTALRERGSEEKEKADRSRTRHILRRSSADTSTVRTGGSRAGQTRDIFASRIHEKSLGVEWGRKHFSFSVNDYSKDCGAKHYSKA